MARSDACLRSPKRSIQLSKDRVEFGGRFEQDLNSKRVDPVRPARAQLSHVVLV